MPKLEIDNWAQGKNLFVASLCQQFALNADSALEILSSIKKQEVIEGFQHPDLHDWLALYKKHRHVNETVASSLQNLGGYAGMLSELFVFLTSKNKRKGMSADPDRMESGKKAREVFYRAGLEDIRIELNNMEYDEVLKKK